MRELRNWQGLKMYLYFIEMLHKYTTLNELSEEFKAVWLKITTRRQSIQRLLDNKYKTLRRREAFKPIKISGRNKPLKVGSYEPIAIPVRPHFFYYLKRNEAKITKWVAVTGLLTTMAIFIMKIFK
jgi:hypothetical protein